MSDTLSEQLAIIFFGFFLTGWIGILLSLPFICLVTGTCLVTVHRGYPLSILLYISAALKYFHFSLMPTPGLLK